MWVQYSGHREDGQMSPEIPGSHIKSLRQPCTNCSLAFPWSNGRLGRLPQDQNKSHKGHSLPLVQWEAGQTSTGSEQITQRPQSSPGPMEGWADYHRIRTNHTKTTVFSWSNGRLGRLPQDQNKSHKDHSLPLVQWEAGQTTTG